MSVTGFIFYNALLLAAAASDLRSFRIPNLLPLLLTLGGFVLPALAGAELVPRLMSLGVISLVTLALYAFNGLGGGDVKLLIAASLWLPIPWLPVFATTLGIAGAVQGLATLAVIRLAPSSKPYLARAGYHEMPYGVSIAAAGLMWSLLATFR